jgi:hypothetical protein
MMLLAQARRHVGAGVVYKPKNEDGEIIRCSEQYVFVRYSWGVAATRPEDLEFLARGLDDDQNQ